MPDNLSLEQIFLCLLLILASAFDLKKRVIPDSICILIILAGLTHFSSASLLGVLPGFVFFLIAYFSPGALGGGDVKLIAAMGFAMGIKAILTTFVFSLLPLIFYLMIAVAIKRKHPNINRNVPLAPFLTAGCIATTIL